MVGLDAREGADDAEGACAAGAGAGVDGEVGDVLRVVDGVDGGRFGLDGGDGIALDLDLLLDAAEAHGDAEVELLTGGEDDAGRGPALEAVACDLDGVSGGLGVDELEGARGVRDGSADDALGEIGEGDGGIGDERPLLVLDVAGEGTLHGLREGACMQKRKEEDKAEGEACSLTRCRRAKACMVVTSK